MFNFINFLIFIIFFSFSCTNYDNSSDDLENDNVDFELITPSSKKESSIAGMPSSNKNKKTYIGNIPKLNCKLKNNKTEKNKNDSIASGENKGNKGNTNHFFKNFPPKKDNKKKKTLNVLDIPNLNHPLHGKKKSAKVNNENLKNLIPSLNQNSKKSKIDEKSNKAIHNLKNNRAKGVKISNIDVVQKVSNNDKQKNQGTQENNTNQNDTNNQENTTNPITIGNDFTPTKIPIHKQIINSIKNNPQILLHKDNLDYLFQMMCTLKDELKLEVKNVIKTEVEKFDWMNKFDKVLTDDTILNIISLVQPLNIGLFVKNLLNDFQKYLSSQDTHFFLNLKFKNELLDIKNKNHSLGQPLLKIYNKVSLSLFNKNLHIFSLETLISSNFKNFIFSNYNSIITKYYLAILNKIKKTGDEYNGSIFSLLEFYMNMKTILVDFEGFSYNKMEDYIVAILKTKNLSQQEFYLQNLKNFYNKYKDHISNNLSKIILDKIKTFEKFENTKKINNISTSLAKIENLFEIFELARVYPAEIEKFEKNLLMRIEKIIKQEQSVSNVYINIINRETCYNRINFNENSPHYYIFTLIEKVLINKNLWQLDLDKKSIQKLKQFSNLLNKQYCSENIKIIYKNIFNKKYSGRNLSFNYILKQLLSLYQQKTDIEYIFLKEYILKQRETFKNYLLNADINFSQIIEYLKDIFRNNQEFQLFLENVKKEKSNKIDYSNEVNEFQNFRKNYLNSHELTPQLENILIAYENLNKYNFQDQQHILSLYDKAIQALKNKYANILKLLNQNNISKNELLRIAHNINYIKPKSEAEKVILKNIKYTIRQRLGNDYYVNLQDSYLGMSKIDFLIFGLLHNKKYYDNLFKEFISEKKTNLQYDEELYKEVLNLKKLEIDQHIDKNTILTIEKAIQILRKEMLHGFFQTQYNFTINKNPQNPFKTFIENSVAPRFGINCFSKKSLSSSYSTTYYLYTFGKGNKGLENAKKSNMAYGDQDIANLVEICSQLFKKRYSYLERPDVDKSRESHKSVLELENIVNFCLKQIKNWEYFFIYGKQTNFFNNNNFEFLSILYVMLDSINDGLGEAFKKLIFSKIQNKLKSIYNSSIFMNFSNNQKILAKNYIKEGIIYNEINGVKNYNAIDSYTLWKHYYSININNMSYKVMSVENLESRLFKTLTYSSNVWNELIQHFKKTHLKQKEQLYREYLRNIGQFHEIENDYIKKINDNKWGPTKKLEKSTRSTFSQISNLVALKNAIVNAKGTYDKTNIFSIAIKLKEKFYLDNSRVMNTLTNILAEKIFNRYNFNDHRGKKEYIEFLVKEYDQTKNILLKKMIIDLRNKITNLNSGKFGEFLSRNSSNDIKKQLNNILGQQVF